ncbi:hypothetical protein OH492_03565 [Vibrio chagasii]|nr:hypothetical protein [Vibrio chagasii]
MNWVIAIANGPLLGYWRKAARFEYTDNDTCAALFLWAATYTELMRTPTS